MVCVGIVWVEANQTKIGEKYTTYRSDQIETLYLFLPLSRSPTISSLSLSSLSLSLSFSLLYYFLSVCVFM